MTVLDIGANVGFYALQLARLVGPAGKVFCFEPYAPVAEYLEHNITANGLTNVTVVRKAVSDTTRPVNFNVFSDGHDVFNSLGVTEPPATSAMVERTIRVETTTIDRFCADHDLDRVNIMKIDVEGAEEKVIAGAADTLDRNHDVTILMETYEPMAMQCQCSSIRLMKSLLAAGFAIYSISELGSLVPIDPSEIPSLHKRKIVNVVFDRGNSPRSNSRV
jgi:FkbM family methyltransferase